MRKAIPVLAVLALSACSPEVPDSAAGVGFDSYSEYSAQRDRALQQDLTVRPLDDTQANAAVAGEPLSAVAPPAAPVVRTNNPGLSDEQSFSAVTARESIESDRARLEAQRQEYTFIAPQPLPDRRVETGPNIVRYALSTSNRVGEPQYRRSRALSRSRYLSNCARYASADLAQQAFLSAGGPQSDRLGLDPDGDGFACFWDPTPFRTAVN